MRNLFLILSIFIAISSSTFAWTNNYSNPGRVNNIFTGDYSNLGAEYKDAFIIQLSDGNQIVFNTRQPQADHWFTMCMTSKKTGLGIVYEKSTKVGEYDKVKKMILK